MNKLTSVAGRREFLKGAAMIGAAAAAKCGTAMMPDEQKAWDKYNAMNIPRPDGLLEGDENIKSIASYEKSYSLLLNSWLYFAILVALFAVEWFLRKWNGGY